MKTIRYIFLSLAACSVLLVSCVKEAQINGGEGVDVSILIATGSSAQTRSETDPGSEDDRKIGHFRVLIFRSEGGTLAYKDAFTPPADPQEINMKTGVYDFVLIANDDVDAVKTQLNALELNESRISDLNGLSFASTSFDSDTRIPMVSVVRGVKVYPEGRIELPGKAEQNEGIWNELTKIWNVELERLAVRLDLTLDLDGHTLDAGSEKVLTIENVPEKVFLFSKNNYELGSTVSVTRLVSEAANEDGNKVWRRIILPESMFSDKGNAEKAVELSLWIDNQECTALIGLDTKNAVEASRNYTLPRNTYLDITATANPQQQALDCSATVVPWNEDPNQNIIADGPYWLKVSGDEFVFTHEEGSGELTAETNYDLTEDKQGYPKGIQVSMEGGSGWITDLTTETEDNKNYTIKFKILEFGNDPVRTAPFRTAKIKVTAGNMTKVINVTQALWGGHADILYFDPTDSYRLKIGRWGTTELNKDNYQQRMVLTKSGGVVGFTIEGTTWDNEYVKFNPSLITITGYSIGGIDTQNSLPNVPAFPQSKYDGNYGPNISSSDYHNYNNIRTYGRGDICQLLGLTAAQIKAVGSQTAFDTLLAGRSDNYKDWRLPTARENVNFVGGASDHSTWITWTNGGANYSYTPTTGADASTTKWPYYYDNAGNRSTSSSAGVIGNPATGRFPVVTDAWNGAYTQVLPAAGYRNSAGKTISPGMEGGYWPSTPASSTYGYSIYFNVSLLQPVYSYNFALGFSVRCVRPVNNHLKY